MTQVSAAVGTKDLCTHHSMRLVQFAFDLAALDLAIETGPAAMRLEFHIRGEEFRSASGTAVGTLSGVQIVLPCARTLGALFAENVVLLIAQTVLPLSWGQSDGISLLFHGV